MKAGVIVYRQRDGGLTGEWTHAAFAGAIAAEEVTGASLAALAGSWPVTIRLADRTTLFTGTLAITPLGSAFALRWEGELLVPTRRPATYAGIGMRLPRERIVAASFEEIDTRDPDGAALASGR